MKMIFDFIPNPNKSYHSICYGIYQLEAYLKLICLLKIVTIVSSCFF
jgi:hypothetical protein